MKTIKISDEGLSDIHCMLCGENITGIFDLSGECEHLHFVHINEDDDESVYDRNNIFKDYDKFDSLESLMNYKFDHTFLNICICIPSPGFLEVNYVFKIEKTNPKILSLLRA